MGIKPDKIAMDAAAETRKENVKKFSYSFPYNHALLAASRARRGKWLGIAMSVAAAAFILFTIFLIPSSNETAVFGRILMLTLAVVCLLVAVMSFMMIKPKEKHKNRVLLFDFYEYHVEIAWKDESINKGKALGAVLYRAYKDKQYVAKVFLAADRLILKIMTGTYNAIPQYAHHTIPLDVIPQNELAPLKDFLTETFGKDLAIKESK
jgi:hypothetical protein